MTHQHAVPTAKSGGPAPRSTSHRPNGGSAEAVRDDLGPGVALDGSLRSRMELGLGVGLGHVRLHTDTLGANAASDQGAPAFTVGEHIAFGAGKYRPGTLRGDAILAHELAHAAQQRGAVEEGYGSDRAVETD